MSDRINPFLIDRILFFHIIQHYLEIFGFVHTFLIDRPNTPAWKWKSASPYISRIRGWINYKKSTFLGKPVPVTCLFKIFRAAGKSMNCYNKRIFLFVIRPIAGRYIDIPVPWQSCDFFLYSYYSDFLPASLRPQMVISRSAPQGKTKDKPNHCFIYFILVKFLCTIFIRKPYLRNRLLVYIISSASRLLQIYASILIDQIFFFHAVDLFYILEYSFSISLLINEKSRHCNFCFLPCINSIGR